MIISYPKVSLDNSKVGSAKGSYVLITELNTEKEIHVGSLGVISFTAGFYVYLGSALGGFKSRLTRHLIKNKIPRWHIDYLLSEAKVLQIILCETERRLECLLSQQLGDEFCFVERFGSSDCQCESHLYFGSDEPRLKLGIRKAIARVVSPREPLKQVIVS